MLINLLYLYLISYILFYFGFWRSRDLGLPLLVNMTLPCSKGNRFYYYTATYFDKIDRIIKKLLSNAFGIE